MIRGRETGHGPPIMWLLSLALLACHPASDGSTGLVTTTDSAGITLVSNTAAPRPHLTLSRIRFEAPAATDAVGSIDAAMLLPGNRLVLADGTSGIVSVWDSTGQLLRRLSRGGRGPGEIEMFGGMWQLGGDSLLVFDFTRRRLLLFDASQGLLRDSPLPVAAEGAFLLPVGLFEDGLVLAARRVYAGSADQALDVRRDSSAFFTVDPMAGTIVDSLGTYASFETYNVFVGGPRGPSVQRQSLPFGRSTSVLPFGQLLLVGDNATYSLELRARGGQLRRRFTRPIPPRPVTEQDIEVAQTEFAERMRKDPNFPPDVIDRLITDNERSPHAPTHPAYGTITIGTDRSIWVAPDRSPADSGAIVYAVFDSTGVHVADVELPATAWLAQVTSEAIVVIDERETGELVVRVLARP